MLLLATLGLAALSSCETKKAPTPLDSPAPSVKAAVHSLTFSWSAVDGAVKYAYKLDDAAGAKVEDGTTEELTVTFNKLTEGAEYSFTLTAYCDETDSDHEMSQAVTVKASTIQRKEDYSAEGYFYDGAGNYWKATIYSWTDGSYTIKDWYNVKGYDLDFTVDSENQQQIVITNASSVSDGLYYYVAAGLSEDICIYTAGDYSWFSGSYNLGQIYFWNYQTNDYSYFVWSEDEEGTAVTADAIAGTYSQSTNLELFDGEFYNSYFCDNDVTVAKVDDTHITISNLIWEDGGTITATLDPASGTIVIPSQSYYGWVFASYTSLSPVIGYYKDNKIVFNSFELWYLYSGVYYSYSLDANTTLTKK